MSEKDKKVSKWFIRSLGGLVLLAYTYRIIRAVVTEDKLEFDGQDWTILISCVAIWVVYESVRAFLRKKAGGDGI